MAVTSSGKGQFTGDKLRPLLDAWPEVGSILGIKGFSSIEFVERAFFELGCTLYLEDNVGLFYPCESDEVNVADLIVDMGTSGVAHQFSDTNTAINAEDMSDEGWRSFRISCRDFDRILDCARSVANRQPSTGDPCMASVVVDYPQELAAAIEAFEAVHTADLAGRSAKSVLLGWLNANRPQLSANARERIATVANWQPTGGAPKTPGG